MAEFKHYMEELLDDTRGRKPSSVAEDIVGTIAEVIYCENSSREAFEAVACLIDDLVLEALKI